MTSLVAVQSCELAWHDHLLTSDLIWLNSLANATNKPLSCPTAVLTDSGPSGPYVDVFQITYYRGAYNAGGIWIPIYYLFCNGPKINSYHISTRSSCPINSTGTTTCTCTDPYVPDAAATSCVPVSTCPVPALKPLPEDAACAQVLENISSAQAQKDAACGALTEELKTAMACFRGKLSDMSPAIPLKITSDIRDVAYQAHFREVWDKMERLVRLEDDPAMQTACAARRAEIAAEKGCDNAGRCASCYAESATQRSHCLIGRPANPDPNNAQHTQGNAFDVSRISTINPLSAALGARNPPQTIPQFLDAPTDCKLSWGGIFTDNYDPIHFYAR